MSTYAEEYAKEEQLYTLYMGKAAHHKRRMESIKYLMEGSSDELDAAASFLIGTVALGASPDLSAIEHQKLSGSIDDKYPKKRMSDKTITLFQHMGMDGKSLSQLLEFSTSNTLGWKDHNIRNMMSQYKKNYDFIESTSPGFYKLTQKGYDAVQKQSVEDKNAL